MCVPARSPVTLRSALGLCTRPAHAHAQGGWDTQGQGQEPNVRPPSGHVPFQNPAQRLGRKATLDYQTSSTFLEYLQPPPPQLQACRAEHSGREVFPGQRDLNFQGLRKFHVSCSFVCSWTSGLTSGRTECRNSLGSEPGFSMVYMRQNSRSGF